MAASRRLPLYRRQHGGHLTQIDELLARLAAADLASAEGALVRLTLQGARTIEPILAAFPQASEAARSRMLRILERVPDRRSLALLNRTAGDGSSGLRRLAVRALGALPARHTLPTLLQLLSREAEPEVRAEIVSILSRQASAESPETLEPVLEILFSQQEAGVVRRAALTSLAGLKPRQSRQLLEKLAAGADDRLGRDIRRLLDAYPA
ncbi:MAG: HEAT repeat domain-containing protein, partial [Akkermansiaceae bacterium]|nr:HEAT repeat domain-containing protein [Akkermansiaceae bacterium]